MGRLMRLCAERLQPGTAVADTVLNWPGDPSNVADSVPLRLAGGLHALVLRSTAAQLVAAYPPNQSDDDPLWQAVEWAMTNHTAHLLHWLQNAPQTNEVRRAAALIPALNMIARSTGLPLALWELGCSAGLNLRCDRFRLDAGPTKFGPQTSPLSLHPEWRGPCPAPYAVEVTDRRGVDLNPLDPATPETRLRLLSYLWPDQPERRHLTEAAFELAEANPVAIDQGDAVDWLAATLPDRPADAVTVLFHTVAWQYLPEAARAKGDALIARAGAAATARHPLARIAIQAVPAHKGSMNAGKSALLSLTLWPGGQTIPLARVDFHGRYIDWSGPVMLDGPQSNAI